MASTYDLAMRGLLAATRAGNLPLPVTLDPQEAVRAQYAGDPASELRKRLAVLREDDHEEALHRLAGQLTSEQAWQALLAAGLEDEVDTSVAVYFLIRHGMLPTDDTLLDLVAGADPLTAAVAVAKTLELAEQSLTAGGVTAFARRTGLAAKWLLARLPVFDQAIDEDTLEAVVAHVAAEIAAAPQRAVELVHRPSQYDWCLTDEQAMRLARRGTAADAVVALRLGRRRTTVAEALLTHRGTLAVVAEAEAGTDDRSAAVEAALARAVVDTPDELRYLGPRTAQAVLERVAIPKDNAELLLHLVTGANCLQPWLAGAFRRNWPYREAALLAADRALITGTLLLDRVEFYPLRDADWLPELVRTVPGVAPALVKALVDLGGQQRHRRDLAAGAAAVLAAVGNILGEDAELWHRLLAGAPGSPFMDPELTVDQAAQVYRTRWEQARARRGD